VNIYFYLLEKLHYTSHKYQHKKCTVTLKKMAYIYIVLIIITIIKINYPESSLTSGCRFWYINSFTFAISRNFILHYYVKNPMLK